jgi:mRNA-degrading endonuclease RelE of RelBE toxin-antitoxin system
MEILSSRPQLSQSNLKKLKGFRPPLYRLRSGDYRVLYRVLGDTVTIMRVIDRKDLEKIIKRINL